MEQEYSNQDLVILAGDFNVNSRDPGLHLSVLSDFPQV